MTETIGSTRDGPPDKAQASGRAETPDLYGAFPRLSEGQIATLSRHGEIRPTTEGQVLYRQAEVSDQFYVVLAGLVAIVDGEGAGAQIVSRHGPGRFLGELGLITGQPAFVGAVVATAGEVLAVPIGPLCDVVAHEPILGDLIVRAYLTRRSLLIQIGGGMRIVGSRFSPDTRRLRDFASRNRLPHRWIDLDEDLEAERLVTTLGFAVEDTPIVICRGDRVLRNPTNAELARAVGLPTPHPDGTICDLVIVGAGPAGLAAAVYAASEGLDTVVLDAVATGGQAGTSASIENYLGFPSGIAGWDLAERAVLQAEKFGAQLHVPARAVTLDGGNGHHVVRLDDGTEVAGRGVLIATGARYRRLDLPNITEVESTWVHYAATLGELSFCLGMPVVVVGGGNSAGQAALFLSRNAIRVHVVLIERHLTDNMSRYLADRLRANPRIEVHDHSAVRELRGEFDLDEVVIEDLETGEHQALPARAVFVFIGADPNTAWLEGQIALDEQGFVCTGQGGAPLLETSRAGVFAAGDVRSGCVRRVAAAVGEGAMAVRLLHDCLVLIR